MFEITQQSLFDYASVDTDTRIFLQEKANETRVLLKQTSEDIIQIGRNLIAAKDQLGQKPGQKGTFIRWAKAELGISQPTAWRFMEVAKGRPVTSFKMNEVVVLPPIEPVEEAQEVGKFPTNEEKRNTVKKFFEDFPQLQALSNREIAKRCGVDHKTVAAIKKEMFSEPEPEPEVSSPLLAAPAIETTIDDRPLQELEYVPDEYPQDFASESSLDDGLSPEDNIQIEPEEPQMQEDITVVEADTKPASLPRSEPSEETQLARDIRRQEIADRNEELREKGVELPQGKYACLVVDPPWEMEKIGREERPNQLGFDYPTMTEEELKNFPLPSVASDDCHLYLWVTQKHLPLAFVLAEHWGFKYQCLLTWVKNVGFTPFSWMYSTEHVLFCAKGSLPLLRQGVRLDFSAKVREHSRKPDEFYDIVREVSPGPRLDVFSREKREGFEQHGNEVEKYVSAR